MCKSGVVGDGDLVWLVCLNNYVSSGDCDDEVGREESKYIVFG